MDREPPTLGSGGSLTGSGLHDDPHAVGIAAGMVVAAAAGGIATVGRRKYAVNLYWQPSPSGRVSQAAREAANQPGQMADFYAVRPGNAAGRVPQFGLGQKEFGHKVGLPTGAASLAEDQPGSWAGVFKIPEGWWLVVSRDDLIAPDGDILFADEGEARARLQDEVRLEGLQRIYAPDNWNIAGSDPVPLTLLMQGRADFKLQHVRFPAKQALIALAVIAAVVGIGYFIFSWQQDRQTAFEAGLGNLTPEQAAIARLQQAQQLTPAAAPVPMERKWEKQPQPALFLEACHQALNLVPATVLGWSRGEVTCSGGALVVAWKRGHGAAVVPPNATVSQLNSDTIASYPLPDLSPRGSETLLDPKEVVRMAMLGDWPVTMTDLPDDKPPAAPAPVAVPGMPAPAAPPPPPPPPWIKKKLTLTSDTAPWIVWQTYAGLPGLIAETVTWDASGKWKLEGTLYENR